MNGMLLRRNRMGGRFLPASYQQVEYLQGDGSAYIDLGVNNKSSFGVRAKALGTSWTNYFGCGATSNNNGGVGIRFYGSAVYFRADPREPYASIPQNVQGTPVYAQSNYLGSGVGFIEGFESSTTTEIISEVYANTNQTFLLFANHNYSGSVLYVSSGKLYHFQLTDGNTLIFDLYPCYRRSDNEPGLYDVVNDVFFSNANTSGSFSVGPEV